MSVYLSEIQLGILGKARRIVQRERACLDALRERILKNPLILSRTYGGNRLVLGIDSYRAMVECQITRDLSRHCLWVEGDSVDLLDNVGLRLRQTPSLLEEATLVDRYCDTLEQLRLMPKPGCRAKGDQLSRAEAGPLLGYRKTRFKELRRLGRELHLAESEERRQMLAPLATAQRKLCSKFLEDYRGDGVMAVLRFESPESDLLDGFTTELELRDNFTAGAKHLNSDERYVCSVETPAVPREYLGIMLQSLMKELYDLDRYAGENNCTLTGWHLESTNDVREDFVWEDEL